MKSIVFILNNTFLISNVIEEEKKLKNLTSWNHGHIAPRPKLIAYPLA